MAEEEIAMRKLKEENDVRARAKAEEQARIMREEVERKRKA